MDRLIAGCPSRHQPFFGCNMGHNARTASSEGPEAAFVSQLFWSIEVWPSRIGWVARAQPTERRGAVSSKRHAAVGTLITPGSAPRNHAFPFRPRTFLKAPQRIDNVIKFHRLFRAWRAPQGGLRFNGTSVGRPGGQDRAFFLQREVRIPHHVPRVI